MTFLVSTTGARNTITLDDIVNLQGESFKFQLNHPLKAFDLNQFIPMYSLLASTQLQQAFDSAWLKKVNGGIDSNNDEAVKTDDDDLVSGTLLDKLIAGNNITFDVITEIGNDKKIRINSTSSGSGSGDKNFVYTQPVATISDTIEHNLNKKVSVVITDLAGEIIDVVWRYLDDNRILVSPTTPTTFIAICN